MTFLQELHKQKERIVYIKLIALDRDDRPLECIQGKMLSGSANMDNRSAMQRVCNLTLFAENVNITDFYWTFNQKFQLEIGLENHIDMNYEDIIWFKYGVYYITSFNCSLSVNDYTISIGGKDKICHLDGSLGGLFEAPTDLGTMEEEDATGAIVIKQIPIKQIIREMVHTYGNEPYHNIIINDLEEYGLILQSYRYDEDLFLIRASGSNEYTQGNIGGDILVSLEANGTEKALSEWIEQDSNKSIKFDSLTDFAPEASSTPFYIGVNSYNIARITYGQTVGYTETPLVYAGELIAKAGESVTSILNKIVQMLGEFEYFYNLEGQFVFQKKKIYINTTWSPGAISELNTFIDPYATPLAYSFNDLADTFSLNSVPAIGEIKNDYSVWGERQGLSGGKVPIHMRYAIDRKPNSYTSITVSEKDIKPYNLKYGFNTPPQVSSIYIAGDKFSSQKNTEDYDLYTCDWRELIYQMARDYRKYGHLDDFEHRVAIANPELYPDGKTGYEQYYIDIEGFWRQLYNPQPFSKKIIKDAATYDLYKEKLYIKVNNEYQAINPITDIYSSSAFYFVKDETFYNQEHDLYPWNSLIYDAPEQLNFWMDFLDTQGELEKFSVKSIGQRPKVVNETSVKAIYYKATPNIIFVNSISQNEIQKPGYRYFSQGSYSGLFSTSSQGLSAKEKIDSLLYSHAVTPESITLSIIPIYNLQPNTRIYINNTKTGINGEYIINTISLPLSYDAAMNISATKCLFNTQGYSI